MLNINYRNYKNNIIKNNINKNNILKNNINIIKIYIKNIYNDIQNCDTLLYEFYNFIKEFLIQKINITNENQIQLAFYNLFFERIIFIKNNNYIPNYECSFEFINYLGTDDIINEKIINLLLKFKLDKNPF